MIDVFVETQYCRAGGSTRRRQKRQIMHMHCAGGPFTGGGAPCPAGGSVGVAFHVERRESALSSRRVKSQVVIDNEPQICAACRGLIRRRPKM